MISRQSNIAKLLNDESFIRWVKDEATNVEKQKWERWLSGHPEKRIKVEKAKKILTMPFVEDMPSDVEQELRALMNEIEKLNI